MVPEFLGGARLSARGRRDLSAPEVRCRAGVRPPPRASGMVPLLLGATFVIFAAVYALPGDPIRAIAGPTAEISPATRAALTEEYHLDDPLRGPVRLLPQRRAAG